MHLEDIRREITKKYVTQTDVKKYRNDPLVLGRMLYGPSIKMLTPSIAEKIGLHKRVYGFFTDTSDWIQTNMTRAEIPKLLEFNGFVEDDKEYVPGQQLSVDKSKAQYMYVNNEKLEQCGPWWGTGSACNPVFVFVK